MSEIATLKRMAASDEYSATETAIFDGAVNELFKAKKEIARLKRQINHLLIDREKRVAELEKEIARLKKALAND